MDTAKRVMAQSYGIRMIVGERDHGWILQDRKPLLFGTRDETEESAGCLNARSMDASYGVAPWPAAVEGQR
jgi:hypothetical protein